MKAHRVACGAGDTFRLERGYLIYGASTAATRVAVRRRSGTGKARSKAKLPMGGFTGARTSGKNAPQKRVMPGTVDFWSKHLRIIASENDLLHRLLDPL